MKYNTFWRRKHDGQIFILISADGMWDVVFMRGKSGEFTIDFGTLAFEFEKIENTGAN